MRPRPPPLPGEPPLRPPEPPCPDELPRDSPLFDELRDLFSSSPAPLPCIPSGHSTNWPDSSRHCPASLSYQTPSCSLPPGPPELPVRPPPPPEEPPRSLFPEEPALPDDELDDRVSLLLWDAPPPARAPRSCVPLSAEEGPRFGFLSSFCAITLLRCSDSLHPPPIPVPSLYFFGLICLNMSF